MTIDEKLLKLQNNPSFYELLGFLVRYDYLESVPSAEGVSKQILAQKSFEKLTDRQFNRFKESVLPLIEVHCKKCGCLLDVSEALEAYENKDDSEDLLCVMCFEEKNTDNNEDAE